MDNARQTYQAAADEDEAAYDVAVSRCRKTYAQASQVGALLDCTTTAAQHHKEVGEGILKVYKKARQDCANKIMSCKVRATIEYRDDFAALLVRQVADQKKCASLVTQAAAYEKCWTEMKARHKAESAALEKARRDAEKKCDEVAAIGPERRQSVA